MSYLYQKYKALIMAAFRAFILGDAAIELTTPELIADMACLPTAGMTGGSITSDVSVAANVALVHAEGMEAGEIPSQFSIVALAHLVHATAMIIELGIHVDYELVATMVSIPAVPCSAGEVAESVQLTCVMHTCAVAPVQAELSSALQLTGNLSLIPPQPLEIDGDMNEAFVEADLVLLASAPMEEELPLQLSIAATLERAREVVVDDFYGSTVDAAFYDKNMDDSLYLTIIS